MLIKLRIEIKVNSSISVFARHALDVPAIVQAGKQKMNERAEKHP